jgi:molybdate transport system substrate-binding protein
MPGRPGPSKRGVAAAAAALLVPAAAAALIATGCRPAGGPPLRLFAAASLADAVDEAAAGWTARSGRRVETNYAGSNTLAQQLAAGAPADLFVSADRVQMERAIAAGRVLPEDPSPLLANRLVVVVPAADPAEVAGAADLARFDRLAMADPEGVPAGVYARRWLQRRGLWAGLAPRVVPALDVRAALAAVAAGHLPAGIVYATDAASTPKVRVAYRVPESETPPIHYWAAPLADGDTAAARDFLDFVRRPEGGAAFTRAGFTVLGPPPGAGR